MNKILQISIIVISLLTLSIALISSNVAWSDKDWCYDQVGDGHPCFETENKCKHEAKLDDAESPCYDEDKDDK
jgi:hypothetical protein